MVTPSHMERDAQQPPCELWTSSALADQLAMVCIVPTLCCVPWATCSFSPYDGYPPPESSPTAWWYRGAVHSVFGGSLCQLLATQSLYWKFSPEGRTHLRIDVAPRNACGACLAPLVMRAAPKFRIRAMHEGITSVRLTAWGTDFGSSVLNDVWKISPDRRIITSMKTRSHLSNNCVCGLGTGPALFVATESLPFKNIKQALAEPF